MYPLVVYRAISNVSGIDVDQPRCVCGGLAQKSLQKTLIYRAKSGTGFDARQSASR
jgi:hypothetical protein